MMKKRWIITAALCVVAVLILLKIIFYGEQPKTYFNTFKELQLSGLIEKGWIPPFFPNSATKIKEQHSLDTNWTKVSFFYDLDDIEVIKNDCKEIIKINKGIELRCIYERREISFQFLENGEGSFFASPVLN